MPFIEYVGNENHNLLIFLARPDMRTEPVNAATRDVSSPREEHSEKTKKKLEKVNVCTVVL